MRSVECRVWSLAVLFLLLAVPSFADRKGETDWRTDPIMIANVTISGRTVTLKEVCRQFERQTSVEFYVDRRFAETPIAMHLRSAKLETAMTCIEEVTGLQWRLIDDMFLLTEDARGAAVVRWNERYAEARKSQVARTTESGVQQWLYDMMPFPPSFDPVWNLTPIQREQIAYQNALNVATMTLPQLDWLNYALLSRGFYSADVRIPTDLLVQKAPNLEVRMNTAMVIESPQGILLVEKPLTAPEPQTEQPPPIPEKAEVLTVTEKKPVEKTALKDGLEGIWFTDEKPSDLDVLLDTARARNFKHVFVPVLSRGQAMYPSQALYPDSLVPEQPDRLKAVIDAAKQRGMKAYAVLDSTLWGDATHPIPGAANRPIVHDRNLLDRTYAEQAQWQQSELAALSGDPTAVITPADKSVYLCPASSQTARLVKAVAEEIARKYDVAGICLDRLDYPQSPPFVVNGRDMTVPFGFTIEVRKEMIRAHQIDPIDIDPEEASDVEAKALWDKFRRGKLTGLVSEVCAAFKEIKPDGICAVTLNAESDAQSPAHWAQLADVDAVMPTVNMDASIPGSMAEHADMRATNVLYTAVSKYSAVVPAMDVHGSTPRTFIGFEVDPAAPQKGWMLRGNSADLVKTLEMLLTSGDR